LPSSHTDLPLGLDVLVLALTVLLLGGQVGLVACRITVIGVTILFLLLGAMVVTTLLMLLGGVAAALAGVALCARYG
jgi:hypothetical protein